MVTRGIVRPKIVTRGVVRLEIVARRIVRPEVIARLILESATVTRRIVAAGPYASEVGGPARVAREIGTSEEVAQSMREDRLCFEQLRPLINNLSPSTTIVIMALAILPQTKPHSTDESLVRRHARQYSKPSSCSASSTDNTGS